MCIRMAERAFKMALSSFFSRTAQFNFSLKCWWKRSQSSSHSSVEMKLEKGRKPKILPFLSGVWGCCGLQHCKCPIVLPVLQALPSPFSSPHGSMSVLLQESRVALSGCQAQQPGMFSAPLGSSVCKWCTSGPLPWIAKGQCALFRGRACM